MLGMPCVVHCASACVETTCGETGSTYPCLCVTHLRETRYIRGSHHSVMLCEEGCVPGELKALQENRVMGTLTPCSSVLKLIDVLWVTLVRTK